MLISHCRRRRWPRRRGQPAIAVPRSAGRRTFDGL